MYPKHVRCSEEWHVCCVSHNLRDKEGSVSYVDFEHSLMSDIEVNPEGFKPRSFYSCTNGQHPFKSTWYEAQQVIEVDNA